MCLFVLFVISLQLVVFLAAFPSQKSVVFLPVLQAGVSVRVCWCGAFPHRVFCYSVHCWCSCWFSHRGFCLVVVSVVWLVCAFPHRGFCSFALPVSFQFCVVSRSFSPLGFLLFFRCCQLELFPTGGFAILSVPSFASVSCPLSLVRSVPLWSWSTRFRSIRSLRIFGRGLCNGAWSADSESCMVRLAMLPCCSPIRLYVACSSQYVAVIVSKVIVNSSTARRVYNCPHVPQ